MFTNQTLLSTNIFPCQTQQNTAYAFAFHLYASLSPVRLGCSALSGLCTRCANCGLTPIGAEISISRSALTLTGSGGPRLCLPGFLPPRKVHQIFFFGQSKVREYLLVGDTGSASLLL